jgi:phosphohistidine phosphatase
VKTLLILRHGRAKRDEKYKTDLERPLTKEGKEDATQIGEKLGHADLAPAVMLSSPAKRAAQTALRVYEALGYQGEISYSPQFYEKSVGQHLAGLQELPDRVETALLVGHNPMLEELVTYLTGEKVSLGTAELVVVRLDIPCWADLREGVGRVKRTLSPGKK